MATRNLYIKISQIFQGKETLLKNLLFTIWLGSLPLIYFLIKLTGNPELVVGIGGKVLYSAATIIGVIYMATYHLNPNQNSIDKSLNQSLTESGLVFSLNFAIIMAVFVWFM